MSTDVAVIDLIAKLQRERGDSPLVAGAADFDRVCAHILSLLQDSVLLFRAGSHSRAAFLAITALEETAKAVLGPYVAHPSPSTARGGILRSHAKKQALGAGPLPLELRPRLVSLLGAADAERVLSEAWSGDLVRVRERALYFEVEGDSLHLPSDAIPVEKARSLLVLVIDAFDDAIVGYTNESYRIGKVAEALLTELKSDPSERSRT